MQKKNAAGTQVELTKYVYDSTSLTSITGITHHDDANFGTGNTVRGNTSQIQRWVSGAGCTANTTVCLTTTNFYDTTGQLLKVTSPHGFSQLYSYTDNFHTDNGANPPPAYTPSVPSNAFLTTYTFVDLPGSSTNKYRYYFHSGKLAFTVDANLAEVFHHYLDPLDRETHIYDRKLSDDTRGWTLNVYTSPTQTDVYRGITDTTGVSELHKLFS